MRLLVRKQHMQLQTRVLCSALPHVVAGQCSAVVSLVRVQVYFVRCRGQCARGMRSWRSAAVLLTLVHR
jgi:hypothetical protein